MNGVHKFQVDAIKTSKIRIFSDNRIPFKVWLSSTEMRAFLICTRLVITLQLTLTSNPHLFFPYSNIWWRCWTSTCDEVGVRCSHSLLLLVSQTRWQVYQLNLTSSACIAVEPPACFTICTGIGDAVEKIYIFPWSLPQATMEESSVKTPTLIHRFIVEIANV